MAISIQQGKTGVLLALAVVIGLSTYASADSVKVGGFWIDGVEISDMSDGKLIYVNNAGSEISKPMAEIEGFKLDEVPQLAAANDAIAAGDYKQALTQLRAAGRANKIKWVGAYIDFQTMMALDQTGDAYEAVQAYLNLARGRADEFYLQNPPMAGIASTEDTKELENAARRLEQTIPSLRGVARENAVAMLDIVKKRIGNGGEAPAAPDQPAAVPDKPATPGTPAAPDRPAATPNRGGGGLVPGAANRNTAAAAAASGDAAVVLPQVLYETHGNDPVTKLLVEGKFQEAIDMSEKILGGQVKDMYTRLYQQGIAQRALADASSSSAEKEKLYKDAGLSFVRIIIYHPLGSLTSAARLEAAYVHQQIGETELANRLYSEASLGIDEEDDPALFARLETLRTTE